jgi:hypothetical protein
MQNETKTSKGQFWTQKARFGHGPHKNQFWYVHITKGQFWENDFGLLQKVRPGATF